jgi:hypothetical protein
LLQILEVVLRVVMWGRNLQIQLQSQRVGPLGQNLTRESHWMGRQGQTLTGVSNRPLNRNLRFLF